MVFVGTRDIGLADHLLVFCVRKYRNEVFLSNCHIIKIKYRNMKNFNEEHFIDTLMNAPWDTCFLLF